jgi:hypothetical protein
MRRAFKLKSRFWMSGSLVIPAEAVRPSAGIHGEGIPDLRRHAAPRQG